MFRDYSLLHVMNNSLTLTSNHTSSSYYYYYYYRAMLFPYQLSVFRHVVNEAGATWNIILGAAHVKFPPDAISETRLIMVHRWEPKACSPPLQNHEYLVSNVIELSADGIDVLEFSKGVSLMLSHSSTKLEGYEVVIKQLVNRESNEWEDLETTDLKHLSGNSLYLRSWPRVKSRWLHIDQAWGQD